MDALAGAIQELHFHLPKIVLTELSREPFKVVSTVVRKTM
jgi:hypothetical protein